MRAKHLRWIFMFFALMQVPAVQGDSPAKPPSFPETMPQALPEAMAKEPRFDFGSVLEGTVVLHEYLLENKGDGDLIIEDVKTSCGCTTASYTRKIGPKEKGSIAIKGNTSGFASRMFSKVISVKTNDPAHREIILHLNGYVESFADIVPARVFLKGRPKEDIQAVVSITPLEKYPFKILETTLDPNLKEKISVNLKPQEGKFILTVKNLSQQAGNYRGRIFLKTDSQAKPVILIQVYGSIEGTD